MLGIILLLLLILFVLMGFLFAWTFWFQAYIYTDPTTGLFWRAPAAGAALTIFLILWLAIDYHAVKNSSDARFPYGPFQELRPQRRTPSRFRRWPCQRATPKWNTPSRKRPMAETSGWSIVTDESRCRADP